MSELAALRVIDFLLGFNLAHSVERVERSDHKSTLISVALLDHTAEEVIVG